ncbi:unnamed protein product, partial [Staurois parvus]
MDTRRPPPSPTYLQPPSPTLLLALCLSSLILPGKSDDFQLPGSPGDSPLQTNSLAVALGDWLDYTQDRGLSLEKESQPAAPGEMNISFFYYRP